MKHNRILFLIIVLISIKIKAQVSIEKPTLILQKHSDDVYALAYSPYTKMLASGSWDNSINLYTEEGNFQKTIKGHNASVRCLLYSRDGRYLFSGSNDFNAIQFDPVSGKTINVFSGHTANVTTLAIDLANKFLFTGSEDGTIKMWDITANGTLSNTFQVGFPVLSMVLSNDGKFLYVAGNSKDIVILDMTGKITSRISGHTDYINSVAISINNKYLATGSNDKNVILWDIKTGAQIRALKGHDLKVNYIQFSFDSRHIISSSNDGTSRIWETETGREIVRLKENPDNKVLIAILTFDKKTAFSGCKSKSQDNYGVRKWALPVDSLQVGKKTSPKIGTGSKEDKNTGLSNNENRAIPNPAPPKPSSSNNGIAQPDDSFENADPVVSSEPDTAARQRIGAKQPPVAATPSKSNADKKPAVTPPVKSTPKTPAERKKWEQAELERKKTEEKIKLEREQREKAIADSIQNAKPVNEPPKSRFKKLN